MKVIAAVTFRPALIARVVPRHVNVHVSWLGVKGNLTQPPLPEPHQQWRRQGFGLFMLTCMIKSMYARNMLTKTVDVYLQCYERQSYNCYAKFGFQQINEYLRNGLALLDGFPQLPKEMQDMLLQEPSTLHQAGECLFHFFNHDFHKKPYRLLLLRSDCLRYFKETEADMTDLALTSRHDRKVAEMSTSVWCHYPSPRIKDKRYEFDSKTTRAWFKDLPLITDLLPPPYDFTLPSSTIGMYGDVLIASRVLHSTPRSPGKPPGQRWLTNGEIGLMLTTLMWDGRYHDDCTVLLSNHTQLIESAYECFRHYTQALQLYEDGEAAKKEDPRVDMEEVKALIIARHLKPVHELAANAQHIRNWLVNQVIAPNPKPLTILSRRLIVFPRNENDAHWSCIFVFNPSYIVREKDEDALQPCFFKYCSEQIHGTREVESQAIPCFLNLCYSVNDHEKNHSINTGVPLKMLFPFGSIKFGSMVGTKAFPALKFPIASQYLPQQIDGFNCGVGVAAAVGIVLRDVIHKGLEHYDEVFAANRMPVAAPVGENAEVYCAIPEVFFTSLATKIEGDYLALIREQRFYLFDNMAASQHVHEPTLRFGDFHTVLQEYTDAVEQCKGWPASVVLATKRYLGKRSPRKVDTASEDTAMPQSDKPKRLDLASEKTKSPQQDGVSAIEDTSIPQSDQSRPSDVASETTQQDGESGHAKTANDDEGQLVDTEDEQSGAEHENDDEANLSTNLSKTVTVKAVTFLQETDTEFKLNDAGKHNYLNDDVRISRMEDNGMLVPIPDDHVTRSADNGELREIEDVKMFTESVNLASRPMAFKEAKLKRSAKRQVDEVELAAELLFKKSRQEVKRISKRLRTRVWQRRSVEVKSVCIQERFVTK